MADENVQGTLRVDADLSAVDKGIKTTEGNVKKSTNEINKALETSEKAFVDVATTAEKSGQKAVASAKKSAAEIRKIEEQKRLTLAAGADAAERKSLARALATEVKDTGVIKREEERRRSVLQRQDSQIAINRSAVSGRSIVAGTVASGRVALATKLGENAAAASDRQRETDRLREEGRKNVNFQVAEERKLREVRAQARSESKKVAREVQADIAAIERVIKRASQAPVELQQKITAALQSASGMNAIASGRASGQNRFQAISGILNPITGQAGANYLAGGGGRIPPGLRPPPAGGGGVGGFFQRNGGRIASAIGTGLGLGAGAFGVGAAINAGRVVIESTQLATAYDRQEVAARNLAGTQEDLNELLDAYTESSGGAVDKATELSNVTRLLATGFANSSEDVEKFVKATRGASIALGKPQDYIIQETQLAISNTSLKRLDQIGLGITEVKDRTKELQEANASLSKEDAFRQAVIDLMTAKYGTLTDSIEGQATGLEKLTKRWKDYQLQMGQNAQSPVNAIGNSVSQLLGRTATALSIRENLAKDPDWKPGFGASALEKELFKSEKLSIESDKFWRGFWSLSVDGLADFRDRLMLMYGMRPPDSPRTMMNFPLNHPEDFGPNAPGGIPARPLTRYEQASQMDGVDEVLSSGYDAIAAVEENANKARLDEIENYESQRESIIISYGKSMVREEEDFARQRARGLRDYERSIVDLVRDSQDREAEMKEDLDKNLAEAREDSNDRIKDIEEEYAEDKVDREKDLRDNLLKAAGQLDAIAVLEARKAFKKQKEDAEEQHREAIDNEKEALQKRIDDALEAYEEQLADGREADAKRLEDMRVNRERQLADEDEDRAIRLARAAEDHNDQLAELDRQHALRLEQIKVQAAEETKALEDALMKDLAALGVHIAGVSKIVKEREDAIEKWFDVIISKLERSLLSGTSTENEFGAIDIPVAYKNATTNSGSIKNFVVQAGAFVINPTAGMDVYELNNLVEDAVIRLLEMDN